MRSKVATVLLIPLLVAVLLGWLSVSAKRAEASAQAQQATNVEVVRAVWTFCIASIDLSFAQAAGSATQPAVDNLRTGIATMEQYLSSAAPVREQDKVSQMMRSAHEALAQGTAPAPVLDTLLTRMDAIIGGGMHLAEASMAPVDDSRATADKGKVLAGMNGSAIMVNQAIGVLAVGRGQMSGMAAFTAAAYGERAHLQAFARRFPKTDTDIAELSTGLDKRMLTMQNPGPAIANDMFASFKKSVEIYQRITTQSADRITAIAHERANNAKSTAFWYTALVTGALTVALALAFFVASSLIRPLRRLRFAALQVAETQLPAAVDRVRDGALLADVKLPAIPVHTDEEVGQVARAVDNINGQALRLAGEQAQLRLQVNDMFETLARRNKSLVDHQLTLIESLEQNEKDPELLESLFRLDHLAARMRRNGENLLVLANTRVRRTRTAPVEFADVLRAAISEVEEYQRVKLGSTPAGAISEPAATDIAHLFAELLDNALRASPPESDVHFTFAWANDGGLVVEVSDRGIGIEPGELAAINARLKSDAEVSNRTARHMGLFVVGKLAERHGVSVSLRPTFRSARDPGVTATVHIPKAVQVPAPQPAEAATTGHTHPSGPIPMTALTPPWAGESYPAAFGDPARTGPGAQRAVTTEFGLPRRVPGESRGMPLPPAKTSTPSQPTAPAPAWDLPATVTTGPQPQWESAGPPVRPDPARMASFFGRRSAPAAQAEAETEAEAETPIFAEIMSAWLDDPLEAPPEHGFASEADLGWQAAARVGDLPAAPASGGLPRRTPGERLIPGAVSARPAMTSPRDPVTVRATITRHQRGVQDGRAAARPGPARHRHQS